jgi:hypothetical protein
MLANNELTLDDAQFRFHREMADKPRPPANIFQNMFRPTTMRADHGGRLERRPPAIERLHPGDGRNLGDFVKHYPPGAAWATSGRSRARSEPPPVVRQRDRRRLHHGSPEGHG